MIMMLRMSVRLGIAASGALLHQCCEVVKQRADVMGAWAGFGMTLKTKGGHIRASQSLNGAIKERYMGNAQMTGQMIRIYGKAMVLGGNKDPLGIQLLHGMIGTMVAEFHLQCFRA
jgi:hypothetical protein